MTSRKKGNPENARLLNRFLILNELRTGSDLSRADLSRKLDLSKMTVSTIVSDLINEGYIVETGSGVSFDKGGRKPILLDLNEKEHLIIGVDIGKTNLYISLATLKGEMVQKKRIKTPTDPKPITIIKKIEVLTNEILSNCAVDKQSLLGMSISIGGLVNKKAGSIVYSPDFGWKDLSFREMVEESIGMKVVIDNCTRAMALGEQSFGSSVDVKNLFYVNNGYGIGSAMILNGRVYDKNSEFGHCFITAKKGLCDCGKDGCLEAHASGHAIAREAKLKLKIGKLTVEAVEIAKMAVEGNEQARAIFGEAGKYLGRAISIAANLYNPDSIVIGGGVSMAGDILMKPLMEEYRLRVMNIIGDTTPVEVSSLGVDAGILGAVALGLESFVFHGLEV